jgi:hypothetical protein
VHLFRHERSISSVSLRGADRQSIMSGHQAYE